MRQDHAAITHESRGSVERWIKRSEEGVSVEVGGADFTSLQSPNRSYSTTSYRYFISLYLHGYTVSSIEDEIQRGKYLIARPVATYVSKRYICSTDLCLSSFF